MATLLSEILSLKAKVASLEAKIANLSKSTSPDIKSASPYSKAGGARDRSHARPVDIKTGLGGTYGGNLCWNDSELKLPPYGEPPPQPTIGYNKHSHSIYSGGALDILTLNLVRYDYNGGDWNPHSQQFWTEEPPIRPITSPEDAINDWFRGDPDDEEVGDLQIGRLAVTFSHGLNVWTPMYIDISRCYFVVPDPTEEDGFKKSELGNPMAGKLYDEDETKTSFIYDDTEGIFRLYAVYAEEPQEEEE